MTKASAHGFRLPEPLWLWQVFFVAALAVLFLLTAVPGDWFALRGDILDGEALFWTFSTIAQAIVAIVAFVGLAATSRLDANNQRAERTEKALGEDFESFSFMLPDNWDQIRHQFEDGKLLTSVPLSGREMARVAAWCLERREKLKRRTKVRSGR